MQLRYLDEIERLLAERPGMVVVDVGGGRRCHFADRRPAEGGTRIVAVDVSAEELALNDDVDEKRVADVTAGLPFADGEVDMIVSRSVLEHLPDVDAFVAESRRALAPGGFFVHVFPSRFAPFSVANRLLPQRLARTLLRRLMPGSDGILGFPAYYRACTADEMAALVRRHGFEVVRLEVSYYQSDYFAFLAPLFLLSLLYEALVARAGRRRLAATVLIVARRA